MIASRTTWLTLAVVVAAASACARDNVAPVPRERQFEFGAHRVQVSVPTGWEALDQGKQKRFRKGEFEIVLQNLGARTPPPRDPAAPEGAVDIDELIDWGLAAVGHDQRRDVKSRLAVMLDGRKAMDIETWNRLDHTNPQRFFFAIDDGDLLALHTERMAFEDSLAAFDAIRDSLHFVSARR